MSKVFVVSDTHFGHANIIKYCGRPYNDTVEMDWDMVRRWNNTVSPEDKVYHLGDVYMGGQSRGYIDDLLSKLNGKKRLILGNHDNGKDQILQKHFQKIDVWRMFSEYGLLLTHVPVHESTLFRGKTGNEENPKKLRNVHGHIHTNPAPGVDYRCVCVEQIGYTPVDIETLRKW